MTSNNSNIIIKRDYARKTTISLSVYVILGMEGSRDFPGILDRRQINE